MGFGSGSGDTPKGDGDDKNHWDDGGEITEEQADQRDSPAERTEITNGPGDSDSHKHTAATKSVNDNQDEENSSVMPEKLGEIDVTDHYGSTDLAQMVMAREYHKENPQVPYAMWRSGTATGRSRTTVEIAPQVDDLVKNVMREFEARYDAEINKADLREFAMVLGLMQTDDLFEMAEEWGLQHNG